MKEDIYSSRARDKEKNLSPHDESNVAPLSHRDTTTSSVITNSIFVQHTATISNVEKSHIYEQNKTETRKNKNHSLSLCGAQTLPSFLFESSKLLVNPRKSDALP